MLSHTSLIKITKNGFELSLKIAETINCIFRTFFVIKTQIYEIIS